MFKKILIANRGEIAVRIIAALKELGIGSVAIYSEPDKSSRHVQDADEGYSLEGQPARVYLDGAQIINLAKRAGADAIHPGYGFLSENADFAQACLDAGIKFIGPAPEVIRRMGSKVESRRVMESAGVPVVPGTTDAVADVETAKKIATKYGYPIAIKASAGGGGRGLKVVRSEGEIENALAGAQREGANYFGSSEVYIEKYLDTPRHIEVQILGDEHGNVVHLGERDCSSQRRHQKLLEETPAPNLDMQVRTKLLEAALRGAVALKYSSAGTLEFLVSGDEFYFLEVNTRVQVEHPITEMVTGFDIVKEQILVASGQKLSVQQADIEHRGHAIEFRVNAEDPHKNFMPNPGTVTAYSEPRLPWVRIDTACYEGYQILPFYDSLLAKLVVWGRTREEAIARGRVALRSYKIEGVKTTIPFHLAILDDELFESGKVSTKYVESELIKRFMQKAPVVAVGTVTGDAKGAVAGGNGHAQAPSSEQTQARKFEVEVNQKLYKVSVNEVVDSTGRQTPAPPQQVKSSTATSSRPPLGARKAKEQESTLAGSGAAARGAGNQIRSAMNGLVKEILVEKGQNVTAGQRLIIFEAMKMESELTSPIAGTVESISVKPGETVNANALLLEIS